MKKIFDLDNLKKITRNKLFGKYFHNLLVHAPLQYRLVSGESINCEDEERFFKDIKSILHNTTDNKAGHLIGHLIVRLQVKYRCKEKYEFQNESGSFLIINLLKKIFMIGKLI